MNIAVVLAGGVGERVGASIPKQYININGKMVIEYVVDTLKGNRNIDRIIIACNPEYMAEMADKCGVEVVSGGDARNKTVKNVLDYIDHQEYSCDKIMFVDSARPMLNDHMIDSAIGLLEGEVKGVITCQKITDSLGKGKSIIDRSEYYLIQTPEAFRYEALAGYDQDSPYTAIYQQVDGEIAQSFVEDINCKLTYKGDIEVLTKLLTK